jgi:hypothetical protein
VAPKVNQSIWSQLKSWLCSKIESDRPYFATLDVSGDFQPILLPGFGGGSGIGVTSNGQVFVEFTAQAELGELTNMSIGVTTSIGRTNENLPVRQPSTEGFAGAQGAFGLGPVVSTRVRSRRESGYRAKWSALLRIGHTAKPNSAGAVPSRRHKQQLAGTFFAAQLRADLRPTRALPFAAVSIHTFGSEKGSVGQGGTGVAETGRP